MSQVSPDTDTPSRTSTTEKGYVLTFAKITDPVGFKKYPPMVPATLAKYDGKMLLKGMLSDASYTENEGGFTLAALLQFPSEQRALEWYNSEEYKEAKALRQKTSEGPFVIGSGPDVQDCKGFLLMFLKIFSKEGMAKYSPAASIAAYKGKFIMKAQEPNASEEFDDFDVGGVVAFPTVELAEAWMASDEYKEMKAIRLASVSGPLAIIGTTN